MLSRFGLLCRNNIAPTFKRNIGITAPCLQKATVALDPIQKLFIDKIHDYSVKSKATGGKLVDMSPEVEKNLHDELEKLAKQYGAKDTDFAKFPTFAFSDPELEAVGISIDPKVLEQIEELQRASSVTNDKEDERSWYDHFHF